MKEQRLFNRVMSIALSIVLVVGLCPSYAYASEQSSGSLATAMLAAENVLTQSTDEEDSEQESGKLFQIQGADDEWEQHDDLDDWDIVISSNLVAGPDGKTVPSVSVEFEGNPIDSSLYRISFWDEAAGVEVPAGTPLGMGSYRVRIIKTTDDRSAVYCFDITDINEWFWDWDILVSDIHVAGPDGKTVPSVSVEFEGNPVDSSLYRVSFLEYDVETGETGAEFPAGTPLGVGSYCALIVNAADDDLEMWHPFRITEGDGNIWGGIYSTCEWTLDSAGELTIAPLDGEQGVLGDRYTEYFPWATPDSSLSHQITSVRVLGKVKAMTCGRMFIDCSSLVVADLRGLDISAVTDFSGMFGGCTALKEIDFPDCTADSVRDSELMFLSCEALDNLVLPKMKFQDNASIMGMFNDCKNLKSVDLSALDTSNVRNMNAVFMSCTSLERLDLSTFDTATAETLSWLFSGCTSLKELDLSGFDTAKVKDMSGMLHGCTALRELDISSFSTASVSGLDDGYSGEDEMFEGCEALARIRLGRDFRFFEDCKLPNGHTWSRSGLSFSVEDFVANYDGATMSGLWSRDSESNSLSDAAVSGVSNATYTGKAIMQAPVVRLNSNTLKEGVDYSLSYRNNTNAGQAAVIIKGLGDYSGEIEKTFTIAPASISSLTLKSAKASYDGKTHKPAVAAVGAGLLSVPASSKSGYSVTFLRGAEATTDFTSAGAITVKVSGSGNYIGSATVTFAIGKAANPMKASAVAKTVKLPKGKKKLAKAATVKGAVKLAKKAAGAVTYVRVSKGSAKCLKISKKTGKVTVAKGTKAGTYKMKVAVKAAGNRNFNAKTQQITLKVRVKKR